MRKILLLILGFITVSLYSQERYLDQVFSEVDVQTAIYGKNYTVLAVGQLMHTVETGKIGQPLAADIYTPQGDTETKRPLVIYFHTGNFLPHPLNGSASGKRTDLTCVEFATKFAKMGYVAASVDYRLGWNPIAETQEARVNTLINAAYRGVQDARTAIRYFKANADLYGVDTTKIMVFGQGTGGYVSLAVASLDQYVEVVTTTNGAGKFIGSSGRPYVIEKIPFPNAAGVLYINGDIEGKQLGIVPPNGDGTPNPGPPPTGDTLNFPNHVNHTSDFAMAVNLGGALGDISWLDENTPPIISIQCPYDLFAPYYDAVLNVPISSTAQLPVVRVQGSLYIQEVMDSLGINDPFESLIESKDPIGTAIKAKAGGHVNLFPMIGSFPPVDSSPWDLWDPATNANHATAITTNPDMSLAKATRFIDSVLMYVAPRACIGLDLPCKSSVSSTKDLTDLDVELTIAPNPSSSNIKIEVSKSTPIRKLSVMDISGRVLNNVSNVNSNLYELQRDGLKSGLYILKLEFDNGVLNKKIMFN